MPAQPSFYEVLSAAINDLSENGFDTQERVDRWTRELEAAARRTLRPEADMDRMLREGLATIYKRMVDRDGLLRYNPGVDRFTLANVKPKLRSELDRRIVASAHLIKLNRQETISNTLRRFQGWATSIPKGGSKAVDKRETKANIRKSLASLPFRERRVLIDQGHKFVSALSEVLAKDGGAIAARWRSHWRQAGYDYREDHKDRDEQVYLVRASWAHNAGLVKQGKAGYTDDVTKPGEEVSCRCYYVWIYNLRDVPPEMLTAKGKRALEDAKAAIISMGAA